MAAGQLVPVAKVIGITSAGILSGLATSFNLIILQTVLKTAPDEIVAKQWRSIYNIGKAVAPPYAACCAICFGFLASQSTTLPGLFSNASFDPTTPFALYSAAAIAIPSIVPWTLAIMLPTNERLMRRAEDTSAESAEETQRLMKNWVKLNWVRVGLLTVGTLLGTTATILS